MADADAFDDEVAAVDLDFLHDASGFVALVPGLRRSGERRYGGECDGGGKEEVAHSGVPCGSVGMVRSIQ